MEIPTVMSKASKQSAVDQAESLGQVWARMDELSSRVIGSVKEVRADQVAVGRGPVRSGKVPTASGEVRTFTCSEGISSGDGEPAEYQGTPYEIRGRRCKSPLCPSCGGVRAWRLAEDLKNELGRMVHPQMWTLTINPGRHPDQEGAFTRLKRKRAVSELVRTLFNRGYLTSREYFCGMEFQSGDKSESGKGTQQIHFHLIVDAKDGYIPFQVVHERWQRFAGQDAAPEGEGDPPMGYVQFEPITNVDGIGAYVCKYLAKGSKGVPRWFKDYLDDGKKNAVMYSASRGFWQSRRGPEEQIEEKMVRGSRVRRPIDERIANCMTEADLFEAYEEDGVERWSYVCTMPIGFEKYVGETATSEEMYEVLMRTGRFHPRKHELERWLTTKTARNKARLVEERPDKGVDISQWTEVIGFSSGPKKMGTNNGTHTGNDQDR